MEGEVKRLRYNEQELINAREIPGSNLEVPAATPASPQSPVAGSLPSSAQCSLQPSRRRLPIMPRLGRKASVGAVVLALLGAPTLAGCGTTKTTTTPPSARELEQLNRELDQVEQKPQEYSAEELKAERDIQRQAKEERETLNIEESNAAKAQSEHEARKHHGNP